MRPPKSINRTMCPAQAETSSTLLAALLKSIWSTDHSLQIIRAIEIRKRIYKTNNRHWLPRPARPSKRLASRQPSSLSIKISLIQAATNKCVGSARLGSLWTQSVGLAPAMAIRTSNKSQRLTRARSLALGIFLLKMKCLNRFTTIVRSLIWLCSPGKMRSTSRVKMACRATNR